MKKRAPTHKKVAAKGVAPVSALPVHRARFRPLPPVFPGAWAVACGEDRYGLWQAFEVAGVRQVMRWVPPGRFIMGSPKTEVGRDADETEHLVQLTQGFWLADTTCTQALWASVMDGSNPSQFKDNLLNPVEQVSWTVVTTEFLPRLNALVPGLAATLPTEAQWEYACRADARKSTPFWFGNQINSEQVNFSGNGPMAGGKKSEYRQRTLPAKVLPCNGWGLYQMHGNVGEWCADWLARYPAGEIEDPTGPSEAPSETDGRVLRGGWWFLDARGCRSAQRSSSDPGFDSSSIGFRLARGAT